MHDDDLALFERSLRHATETYTGPALDAALTELGWHDAVAIDPRVAVSLLFELQGAANATSSALTAVVAQGLGLPLADSSCALLPAIGRYEAPGEVDGDRLTIDGFLIGALDGRDSVVVVSRDADRHIAVTVSTSALELRSVHGVDPSLELVEVAGEVAVPAAAPAVDWRAGVALGQLATGHELVGTSSRMLELARVHALDRVQFGRPIAAFQAVRHRLADALVAIETAKAALDAGWLLPSPQSAAIAKAVAARSARTVARHCQQVLAGIGFTTEHDLHHHVKRVLVLEQLLGATRALTRELGQSVIDSGRLPDLLPLKIC
jgi:hypothetical protein